jgi:hypothetical protein
VEVHLAASNDCNFHYMTNNVYGSKRKTGCSIFLTLVPAHHANGSPINYFSSSNRKEFPSRVAKCPAAEPEDIVMPHLLNKHHQALHPFFASRTTRVPVVFTFRSFSGVALTSGHTHILNPRLIVQEQ